MIASCSCSNKFQDNRYGKGLRVHNPCKLTGDIEGLRCSVCGKEKPIPAAKGKAAGKRESDAEAGH